MWVLLDRGEDRFLWRARPHPNPRAFTLLLSTEEHIHSWKGATLFDTHRQQALLALGMQEHEHGPLAMDWVLPPGDSPLPLAIHLGKEAEIGFHRAMYELGSEQFFGWHTELHWVRDR